jgi:hypothetical protein
MWRYNYIVNVSGSIVDAVEELGIDQQELQNKLKFTSPRKQQYTVMKSNGKDISYTDLFYVTFHGILKFVLKSYSSQKNHYHDNY